MNEIELKFQVPAASRPALVRALGTPSARRLRLRAIYVDTPDRRLARAGLAWRLRQEGRRWVQTLKGRGDGMLQRPEDEVVLPRAPRGLLPEVSLHAATAVGERLQRALEGEPVFERFRSDIQRASRTLRVTGASVEVSFDQGRLLADGRSRAVCEVEFELKSGSPGALLTLAARWAARFGLWLDVRTKAEAGQRLADAVTSVPPTVATQPALQRHAGTLPAFAAVLLGCLQHLLPNQAELASADVLDEARAEHLHQWRVAVRRLRSALRVLGRWSSAPEQARALQVRWGEAFAATSAARDADVGARLLAQPLQHAGLAMAPGPAPGGGLPAAWFSHPALTLLVLDTLALAHAESPPAPTDQSPPAALREAARRVCRRLARRVQPMIEGFAALSVDERHDLRKRLKRLRYVAELLSDALPARGGAKALARLRHALDALGVYNDLLVAQQSMQGAADTPATWFARGWLLARLPTAERDAASSLRRLRRLERVWAA